MSIACDDILFLLSTCPIPMITLAYTLVVCNHFLFIYFFDFFGYESCACLCSTCFYLRPINVFVDIFGSNCDAWLVLGPYVRTQVPE
ncbi:hypothetical protein BDA96_06G256800 [Sorghum bicolor]|uniref:Uncharacterized protein n=1 Tax=Sorghum bicolor TaxID=4558 RepID=A0A921QT56_SORBI|nr:hypothetical protein BDA96_06G256800 [Sorghum bicolor]